MGANGCGKSTLFSLMTKNFYPRKGNIFLKGKNIQNLNLKEFARKVAIVQQYNSASDDITVENLVAFGRTPHKKMMQGDSAEDERMIQWALEVTNLTEYRDREVSVSYTHLHVYFGDVIGATANGRKAHIPVSEGISPEKSADVNGPTAVIKSCAKMDHLATAGTLLNQKFTPDVVAGEEGLENMASLIRSYFSMDGHHIQFNVIDRQTLIEAQKHPEDYKDLIVRVAGYSDFFRNLSKPLQDEIINRTEQSFN